MEELFPQPTDPAELTAPSDAVDRACWARVAPWLEHADPAVVANSTICLIHQANYLLDQQIAALERDFIRDGGYSEKLAAARIAERERSRRHPSDPSDRSDSSSPVSARAPDCPLCGKPLVLRTARKGRNAGAQFWGCSVFPDCKGTLPLEPPAREKRP